MTAAARSVCYFGFYLYVVGITLIAEPNFLLSTFKIPETSEVWIRVAGVLAFSIGYYYHRMGAGNVASFFKHTVSVLLEYISPALIIFGVVDLAGAAWTWLALKKEK